MNSRLWTDNVTILTSAALTLAGRKAGAPSTPEYRSPDSKVSFESVGVRSIFEYFVSASSSSKTLPVQTLDLGIFEGGSHGRVTSTARGRAFITPRFASGGPSACASG